MSGVGLPVQGSQDQDSVNGAGSRSCMREEAGPVWRSLYGEVQCIMDNGRMETPPATPVNRKTDRHQRKHYLPATSLGVVKMNKLSVTVVVIVLAICCP